MRKKAKDMTKALRKSGAIAPIDIKVKRTLSEISRSLDPESIGPKEANALAQRIADQMAHLPASDAIIIRQRVGVAVTELETLIAELKEELSTLGDTLKTVTRHSTVAAAYHRRYGPRPR